MTTKTTDEKRKEKYLLIRNINDKKHEIWVEKLTIRRLLCNNYIGIDVGMDNMTVSTSTNSSLYPHQAVLLRHSENVMYSSWKQGSQIAANMEEEWQKNVDTA